MSGTEAAAPTIGESTHECPCTPAVQVRGNPFDTIESQAKEASPKHEANRKDDLNEDEKIKGQSKEKPCQEQEFVVTIVNSVEALNELLAKNEENNRKRKAERSVDHKEGGKEEEGAKQSDENEEKKKKPRIDPFELLLELIQQTGENQTQQEKDECNRKRAEAARMYIKGACEHWKEATSDQAKYCLALGDDTIAETVALDHIAAIIKAWQRSLFRQSSFTIVYYKGEQVWDTITKMQELAPYLKFTLMEFDIAPQNYTPNNHQDVKDFLGQQLARVHVKFDVQRLAASSSQ